VARCMTRIASRALPAPAQDARIVAQEGTGTGLGGGSGDAEGLASGDGLGVSSGVGLASSEGVGLVAAVPQPPHPASANSRATATPSLNGGWNDDRVSLVTRGAADLSSASSVTSTVPTISCLLLMSRATPDNQTGSLALSR
jgi:hypothetical protein